MTASYVMEVSDYLDTLIKLGKFVAVVMSGYVSFFFLFVCFFRTVVELLISFHVGYNQSLFFSPGLLSMG